MKTGARLWRNFTRRSQKFHLEERILITGARVVLKCLDPAEGDFEGSPEQPDRGQTDQELLEAFARGSEAALCRLVANYRAFLLSHCRRIVGGDVHDAKDLYSLVILKLCSEPPDQIRKIRNLGGWLCRVARNQHIDQRRTHQAEERRNDNLKAIYETADAHPASPEENLLSNELLTRIDMAFESLPSRLRIAAELRFVEDASYDIISSRLGITPLNARKRVQQARRLMISSLVNYVSVAESCVAGGA